MESPIEIKVLETDEGKVPFEEWYDSLKDKVTKVPTLRDLKSRRNAGLPSASESGNPQFSTVQKIVSALGLQISIEPARSEILT